MLEALKTLLETVPDSLVERNSALPEKIPDGILRDGDPSEPEQALGSFGSTYYQYAVEIEVYVEEGMPMRGTPLDQLQQIGSALEAEPRRPRLRPDLRPAPNVDLAYRRCAGDQDRDAYRDRRLRQRRTARLPELLARRPGQVHDPRGPGRADRSGRRARSLREGLPGRQPHHRGRAGRIGAVLR